MAGRQETWPRCLHMAGWRQVRRWIQGGCALGRRVIRQGW